MVWHDGLNVRSVHQLSDEEKERAFKLLIAGLRTNAWRCAAGLRELHDKRAIPYLHEALAFTTGKGLVEVAAALNVLEGTTDYCSYIIRVLETNSHWGYRMDAAITLRKFHTPEVIEALFRAIEDPDYLVRHHASESLLALHGFPPDIARYDEIFDDIIDKREFMETRPLPTDEEILEQYKQAASQLRELFSSN
ncbi:MAG: hypothetical protein GF308_07470 [Candidatus Heimdallarchaeota archaeon]|nr:hypothetical protein [Candidatus Heimdallarchaeota archaeon]